MLKVLSVCIIGVFTLFTKAYVSIDVGKAHIRQSQIAIQPFVLGSTDSKLVTSALSAGSMLFKLLQHNLAAFGRFNLIDPQAFLEKPGEKAFKPYPEEEKGFIWNNWQILNTDYLILGSYYVVENKQKINSQNRYFWKKPKDLIQRKIYVECFVYHVSLKKLLLHRKYTADIKQVHDLSNYISNDIVKKITGKSGIFLTQIAAVKKMSGIKKELFLMNWDGSQARQVSFHQSIVMSPIWSPKGDFIAYTAFLYHKSRRERNAALLLYNRKRKTRHILFNRLGATLAFDFFPTGQFILASILLRGNRNIVKISKTGKMEPVTTFIDGSINVEPSIHPNGQSFAFSSDRGGKVMIYSMAFYKKTIRRLTYQGSYNSTPDYSPDGKQIVFAGFDGGRTDIFIMQSDGSHIRRLTSVKTAKGKWANNESPCFSPDGEHIVFTSNRSGLYQLYIMNLNNYQVKKITHDSYGYKSPKWSPALNH